MERLSRGRAQRIASKKERPLEHGSKMPPRTLQIRSKIAPTWLPRASRAPPTSATENGISFCSLVSCLGRLSGRSWVALGRSWRSLGASWAVPGPPGALLGAIFVTQWASFGTCLGLFFRRLWKNTKTLIFDDSCSENQGLGVPGGSNIEPKWLPNRSWARLGASWRSLGASRRCLGVSWRSWGLLGASWAALGAISSSNIKPGYRGTGSALKARVASTARKARAARAARTGRARAPAP